jgi:hypothetical protein
MTNSEILMIVFTAVIAVTGVIGAIIFNGQLGVMSHQLNEMKTQSDLTRRMFIANQRAWLAVDVKAPEAQGIIFDQNGAVLEISFLIKNVGNAPAIKVSWNAWLIAMSESLGHPGPFSPLVDQAERCNKIRKAPFGIGPTIFPQDQYKVQEYGAGASWDEINAAVPMVATGNARTAIFGLAGCVDYAFPSDPDTHHQTGFVYLVSHPNSIPDITTGGGNVISPATPLVPLNITLGPGAD